MLIQELVRRGQTQPNMAPQGFQVRAVRYFIVLTDDGTFVTIQETQDESRKNSRGVERLIPDMVRSFGIRPIIFADKASYVLGHCVEGEQPGREIEEHEAFKSIVKECLEATGESAVEAVAAFLDAQAENPIDLPMDFDSEARMTFRVLGNEPSEFPIDLPSVRRFWAERLRPSASQPEFECIACGSVGPLAGVHPVTIKRIPGGQSSGNFIVSADGSAFESYGLKGNETSPMCLDCAVAYGNSLNDLLSSELTSYRTKSMAFAFWTTDNVRFNAAKSLSDPSPEEVKELLRSPWTGETATTEIDEGPFHAVGLGASGSRVAVRTWLNTTVHEARSNLARYFQFQDLVMWNGDPSLPLSVTRIGNSIVRDPKKEVVPNIVSTSLVRLALSGTPLPLELLFLAVKRNRAAQDVSRERAMLIKMVLQSDAGSSSEKENLMSGLNPNHPDEAYHCGRLLAVLDEIQHAAQGKLNATVLDKYYGTASSAPASVFGSLIHGAQNHMGKLRGSPNGKGAYIALDRKLQDVMVHISDFPTTLSLPRQGLFALGFYHERAERWRGNQSNGLVDDASESSLD